MHGTHNVADEPLDLSEDATDLVVTFADTSSSISGTIVDAAGAPTTTSDVIIFPADSDTWQQNLFAPRRVRITASTKSGTYTVDAIPAGDYFIAAVDSGQTANWMNAVFLEKLRRLATRVSIADGDKKTQVLTLAVIK